VRLPSVRRTKRDGRRVSSARANPSIHVAAAVTPLAWSRVPSDAVSHRDAERTEHGRKHRGLTARCYTCGC
jgi:hypothetical protein